jgi:alkanesulfonate monooxygenase
LPPVQLGLLLHTGHYIRDDAARPDLSPVLDMARRAEELGFDHVWIGDSSRMERDWPRAGCVSMLAALAIATQRIRIGVIPLNAPLRHPVLLGHELATVDVLAGGRLLISPSVGKAGPEGEREAFNCGLPYNERGPRFSEILEIMRRLWTEPAVDFEGSFFRLKDATVFPKPIQRPIPTYVCTGRDECGFQRAARYGDGWFTATADPAFFGGARQKIEAYAREFGRHPRELAPSGLYATFHLGPDGDRARDEAPELLRSYFGVHARTTTDFFGSPPEIAAKLRPLVDQGLTMLVIRYLDQDLPKQLELTREALTAAACAG